MQPTSPADYARSLMGELERLYGDHLSRLNSFSSSQTTWKTPSLNRFLLWEKQSMSRIVKREAVLARWLKETSALALLAPGEAEGLPLLRRAVREKNDLLMKEIRSAMNRLREEQKSLRIPRTKPIRKESVPALIDITL